MLNCIVQRNYLNVFHSKNSHSINIVELDEFS